MRGPLAARSTLLLAGLALALPDGVAAQVAGLPLLHRPAGPARGIHALLLEEGTGALVGSFRPIDGRPYRVRIGVTREPGIQPPADGSDLALLWAADRSVLIAEPGDSLPWIRTSAPFTLETVAGVGIAVADGVGIGLGGAIVGTHRALLRGVELHPFGALRLALEVGEASGGTALRPAAEAGIDVRPGTRWTLRLAASLGRPSFAVGVVF